MTDIQKENKSGGKVPNLRFPSFEGEWEVKKLGEIAEKIGDGLHGTPSYTDESNYYFINGNNLINGKIEITENTKKIDAKTFLKNDKNLRKNTLLISINGTIGNIAKYNNENVMLGKSVGYFNFEENSDFLYFVLQTSPVQEHFKSELTGSTIKNLSLKTLRETNLRLPSQDEQQKVASFLSLIDERITTQSKIINDLKTLKTATAKKIFSQELRFKDDNGNDFSKWEEMKLKNIVIIQMGQSPDSSSYNFENIGIPLIQGNADILNRKSNPRQYTSKPTKFCDVGDLLLTVRAPVGYVGKSKHYACIGRGICSVKNNDKSILEFIYQFLLYFEDKWKSIEQGSTFTAVNSSDINSINILLPSIPEQTKIANFLSSIDLKIDIENQLLQKLEEQKKFLLQNMFV